jgi:hypothetical protein
MEIKTCGRCKIEKDVCEFGLVKSLPRSTCNECRKIESKEYREKNPENRKKTISKYYETNRDVILIKLKKRTKDNPENKKEISLKSYNKNKEKYKERIRLYKQNNKEKRNEWERNRKETNPEYKLIGVIRTRLSNFLKNKNITKKNKTFEIVGCTKEFLREYIEKQFTEDMSWENHGMYGWHIDHIIPLASAKDEDEIYKLCHYTNLQPLWWFDNLSKGSKMDVYKNWGLPFTTI